MNDPPVILSIDQGTTSSRAMLFDADFGVLATAQQEFPQHFPADGWVEHDPLEIWHSVTATCGEVLKSAPTPAAIGIANQRETTVIWDRDTGEPVYNAIVWQDRRTADWCAELKRKRHEAAVTEKTGLLLDPYFSASKIRWILDNVDGARQDADAGRLAFGAIDSFLVWKLTGGAQHLTDASNAARTLLYNIHEGRWDSELLELFGVPESLLPEVMDCAGDYGVTSPSAIGVQIPIRGVAGDQQAALVGQACFTPGMIKSTYGTGCFMVLNTGDTPIRSDNGLLTTIGYRLDGETCYALEGALFNAGTSIQWLRDGLGVIRDTAEIDDLLDELESNQGVYLVPAFTGLGAPHWKPHARGLITGLTRDTRPAHLVRAALESVCYQTLDLVEAMARDSGLAIEQLRVDGGMSVNARMLQFLSDVSRRVIRRPVVTETTALGAAYLAALQSGMADSLEALAQGWRQDREFHHRMDEVTRQRCLHGWKDALRRCLD